MQIKAYFSHYCCIGVIIFAGINTSVAEDTASKAVKLPEVFDITSDPNFFPYRQSLIDFLND